ncbi:uncharacterized protein LOC143305933 [Osmia lignaria lignaria]|uniref:uncharacterized protein LOC143305933 n=1 Tax=Osmia lignaria lignaria TaxID=1437193 RepID=UPI00402BED61
MSTSWSTGLLILAFSAQMLCNHDNNDLPIIVSRYPPNHPRNKYPHHHSGNDDNAIAGNKPSSSAKVDPPVPNGIPNPYPVHKVTSSVPYEPPIKNQKTIQVHCPPAAVLNFARVGLRRIGDAFIESSETKELYLDSNEIAEISSTAFSSLNQLEVLSLSNNNIPTEKLLWFAKHYMLRKLVLDDNRYNDTTSSSIQKIFQSLPKLEELSLKRDGISRFAVNLNSFAPRLKYLQLSGNSIDELDFLDDLPATMTYLHLDDNQITKVRSVALKHLVELSVSGNQIEQLCSDQCSDSYLSLNGLERLQRLDASRNSIKALTDNPFSDTKELISLDLSRNKIKTFPVDIFKPSPKLEELFLSHNQFPSVPNICSLNYLRQLDLSYNNIGVVAKNDLCGGSNHQLHTLLLRGNHITEVDTEIYTQLKYLKKLDLSDNLILHLPVTLIHRARSLQTLLLRNNNIENIDELFNTHSSTLQDLHLQGNPISVVKYSVRSNTVVYLKDVPRETKEEPEDLTSNEIDDKDYSSNESF